VPLKFHLTALNQMTPEAKVKKKINAALDAVGAYHVNYIGGLAGNNGTPDIIGCHRGRFFGIEAKAGTNKPTDLQMKRLQQIADTGGLALVINETNILYLVGCMDNITKAESNYEQFRTNHRNTDDQPEPRLLRKQTAEQEQLELQGLQLGTKIIK